MGWLEEFLERLGQHVQHLFEAGSELLLSAGQEPEAGQRRTSMIDQSEKVNPVFGWDTVAITDRNYLVLTHGLSTPSDPEKFHRTFQIVKTFISCSAAMLRQ